jgi:endo-1,3(4)-beta-glucanase
MVWLLYAIPASRVDPNFNLMSSTLLQGMPGFSGTIQIAKIPVGAGKSFYDVAAGVYVTRATISALPMA